MPKFNIKLTLASINNNNRFILRIHFEDPLNINNEVPNLSYTGTEVPNLAYTGTEVPNLAYTRMS